MSARGIAITALHSRLSTASSAFSRRTTACSCSSTSVVSRALNSA
jgi:hypothetical protein